MYFRIGAFHFPMVLRQGLFAGKMLSFGETLLSRIADTQRIKRRVAQIRFRKSGLCGDRRMYPLVCASVLLVAVVFGSPTRLVAQCTCPPLKEEKPKPGEAKSGTTQKESAKSKVERIKIDAYTGGVDGQRNYGRDAQVQLCIENKNPFAWQYKLEIKEIPIPEPSIGSFLSSVIGAPGVAALAELKESAVSPKEKAVAEGATSSCGAIRGIIVRHEAITELAEEIETSISTLAAKSKAAASQLELSRKKLILAQTQCTAAYTEADRLAKALKDYGEELEKEALDEKLKKLRREVLVQKTTIEDAIKSEPCKVPVEPYRQRGELFASHQTIYEADAADLKKSNDEVFKPMAEKTRETLDHPRSFSETHMLFPSSDRADFEIDFQRKAVSVEEDDFKRVTKFTVNIGGGPRFALGGGVAFTPLDANKFVRITGFQRPRTGDATDTLTSVVGVGENSTSRITPLAMLHANLATGRHVGIAASLGVTAKAGVEGTDVEYLLGPSFSFLDNRVFITIGGYAGKQHKLAGDLFVGAALPQDLNEIPTEKNTKWSIGFGLTWKIQ